MTTALISHDNCALHEIETGHPEAPQRLAAITDQLMAQGLFDHLLHLEAPLAERETLYGEHAGAYVDTLFESAPSQGQVRLDADTAMNAYSLDASLRGVGAGLLATDQVATGQVDNAFCLTRPPGHHAERDRAMGFCFWGNIAIAARHAIRAHGMQRVAIVDFDVHHGNGTEDIVEGDESILFCSSFQHPLYPGNYRPSVPGQRVNVPLHDGTTGMEFREAIRDTWLPALERFEPEMIFISAGFDAHLEDPLAGLALVDADYGWITEQLMDVADRHAGGRIVSILEGGYALSALGRSAGLHVRTLMGLH